MESHVILKRSAWRMPLLLQQLRALASGRVRTHARLRVGQKSAKAEARLRTDQHTRAGAALGFGWPRDRKPICCKWRAVVLLPEVQHAAGVKTLYAKLTCHRCKRGQGKWNSRGQRPVDVELISLAARTRPHVQPFTFSNGGTNGVGAPGARTCPSARTAPAACPTLTSEDTQPPS